MDTDGIVIYDGQALAFSSVKIEKLATGFQFTEGPVWHPDGFLLFSDIPANQIIQLFPGGNTSVYLDKSGFSGADASMLSDMIGSNGLAFDRNKHLIICQHGNHAIAGLTSDKKMYVLTSSFERHPFNSPNDLVISRDGSIYFTDPPYGLKEQVIHPSLFQHHAGLYRYYDGQTFLLSTDMRYPNGVCFSPGEEFLYAGSNHPDEPYIWKYTLRDGSIIHQSVLIEHNADGIKTDDAGRVYLATDTGILVVSPGGKRLAMIPLPETPANLAWNKDYTELFVTARSSVYRVRNFK